MNIIEIKNISKTYSNGKKALNNVSFNVKKGEFIALLGPNGAGKSTLINTMADVVKKEQGELISCGYNYDTHKNDFKRTLGIVPQEINSDPFSNPYEALVFQQGAYGLPFNKQSIIDTLKAMGLQEQIYSPARSLSGGMKRRLLVAKALIHDPEVIILDEPTAGVDVDLRQHLWKFLKELNRKGKTIILTTHYLEEAEYLCDKIAIINKGELITFEDKKTLINRIGSKFLEVEFDNLIQDLVIDLKGYNFSSNDNKITIEYKDDKEVGDILKVLIKQDLNIQNVKNNVSSLEEVFLKLTK